MADNDYGLFLQRMRVSRGFTQDQLAELAGLSESSVRKLEASGDSVIMRAKNLNAILTAMAMRAPLGPSEIQVLCEATDRLYESFEALNDEAERRKRAAELAPGGGRNADPTLEERISICVNQLIAAGMGPFVLSQLEAMTQHFGEQIAQQQRRPTRRLQVHHPERQVGDMVIRETSHYAVDDDDPEPRQMRPLDQPQSPHHDQSDTDTRDNTGS